MNANIRVWRLRSCSISFVGVVIATGGAETVAFDENAGVKGTVCTVVDAVVGGAGFGVNDAVPRTSGVILVDAAFLVASSMLFLASLNLISTFPSSAFNKRSCVSIDSFSAAALALFVFLFDVDFPDGAPVGGAACWASGRDGGADVLVAWGFWTTMSFDGQFDVSVVMTTRWVGAETRIGAA